MPYCCQCGQSVGSSDTFCAVCGARQPRSNPVQDTLSSISGRTASLLCYIPVVGWVAAIVVLAAARFRHDTQVRFHAFQGVYLFVAWLIVDWVLDPVFSFSVFPGPHMHRVVPQLFRVIIFIGWIFMMVKVSHDETYKLPILGELAEKSVSEQR